MKIGLVAFEIGTVRGFENVRSAHIQNVYNLVSRCSNKDLEFCIYTNKLRNSTFLPDELSDTKVRYVSDPRKRKKLNVMDVGFSRKLNLLGLLLSICQLIYFSRKDKLDVVHVVNGAVGVGIYASILSIVLPKKIKLIWSPTHPVINKSRWINYILSQIDTIVCSTDYLRHIYSEKLTNTRIAKPGVNRLFKVNSEKKHRVTFFRDPSYENGADVALDIFKTLSQEFKHITFTMMVRPHFDPVELDHQVRNIEVHHYPYRDGITLENILSETVCCIFPFRELSTNPQLSPLETSLSGIMTFVSNVDSLIELNGEFCNVINGHDARIWAASVKKYINNAPFNSTLPHQANKRIWKKYASNIHDIYKGTSLDV